MIQRRGARRRVLTGSLWPTDRPRIAHAVLTWAQTGGSRSSGVRQFPTVATLFACGAGDGNRTRTVSLGRVRIPPCSPVLQRYWRPQLAASDPYRPGLVAHVWPGCLSIWVEAKRFPVDGDERSHSPESYTKVRQSWDVKRLSARIRLGCRAISQASPPTCAKAPRHSTSGVPDSRSSSMSSLAWIRRRRVSSMTPSSRRRTTVARLWVMSARRRAPY